MWRLEMQHRIQMKKIFKKKRANMAYILIILQQIPCYLKPLRRLVCRSKSALGWCTDLHRGIISKEDALVEVTDIQHIRLILGVHFFATSTMHRHKMLSILQHSLH